MRASRSFSLTTLGYGDILAVHPAARSLALFEALVGQLYPAILIAKLVSLQVTAEVTAVGSGVGGLAERQGKD